MTVSCNDFLMHYGVFINWHLSSSSTCLATVITIKSKFKLLLPVKYISNLVVIADRFLSKACVCKDKISALSHILEGYGSKLKHYYKLPSLQHPGLWKLSFCISPCSETPLAKCDQIVLLYSKSRKNWCV